MTIAALERATFVGLSSDKEKLLDDLYKFGTLEIIPLGENANDLPGAASPSQSREALRFLLTSPQRRSQVHDSRLFDAAGVERRAL
ncbi:MAG: ATPase V, partial [Planctomycetaceae bacterium]